MKLNRKVIESIVAFNHDVSKRDEPIKKLFRGLFEYIKLHYSKKYDLKEMGQKRMAELANVPVVTINRLLSGNNISIDKNKEISHIERICDFFEVNILTKGKNEYEFSPSTLLNNEKLQELATKLACNLVTVSTTYNEKLNPYKKIIKKESLEVFPKAVQRERFILVTGAGVSHAATKGDMPLADEAIKVIEKEVVEVEGIPLAVIEKERRLINLATGLDYNEFETQLLAYSKFSPEGVKRGLKKMCEIKHLPNLEYEILAHMLKHRFIDIALNFNYDEIFDTNLKEEVTSNDFYSIFSDGHCPSDNEKELLIHNRLKQPIYIKPHGTISHTNTLRFTKEKFAQLPIRIRETIKYLIAAKLPSHQKDESMRVNFIVIGFGMKSPILLETIKEHISKENNEIPFFWFFDTKKNLKEFNLELTPGQEEIIQNNSCFFPVSEKEKLSDYLGTLWSFVEDAFYKTFKPRGIERHILTNKIFDFTPKEVKKLRVGKDKTFLKKYLKDRILVELVIRVLVSDGIINLAQIMESRIGNYFQELNELLGEGNHYSITQLCNQIGLKIYKGFVTDAYTLDEPYLFYEERLYKELYHKLRDNLSFSNRLNKMEEESFTEIAFLIRNRNSLKITPQFKHPHSNLFSSVKDKNILNTGLSWLYEYRKFLEQEKEWDLILAISEKGRFIPNENSELRKFYVKKGKQMELVLSAFDLKNFENISPNDNRFTQLSLLSDKNLFLPWWLHNRHMVIFLKRKKNIKTTKEERKKWKIKEAFYYESRMLSRKVNPIRVTEEEDLNILLNIYANYWHRARTYTKELNKESKEDKLRSIGIPIIQDEKELGDYVEKLLGLYKLPD